MFMFLNIIIAYTLSVQQANLQQFFSSHAFKYNKRVGIINMGCEQSREDINHTAKSPDLQFKTGYIDYSNIFQLSALNGTEQLASSTNLKQELLKSLKVIQNINSELQNKDKLISELQNQEQNYNKNHKQQQERIADLTGIIEFQCKQFHILSDDLTKAQSKIIKHKSQIHALRDQLKETQHQIEILKQQNEELVIQICEYRNKLQVPEKFNAKLNNLNKQKEELQQLQADKARELQQLLQSLANQQVKSQKVEEEQQQGAKKLSNWSMDCNKKRKNMLSQVINLQM